MYSLRLRRAILKGEVVTFSDNRKVIIGNARDNKTQVELVNERRIKILEKISRYPEEAVPGHLFSITEESEWFYEIVSIGKDEIHLNRVSQYKN